METWYNKLLESNVKSLSSEYKILKHLGASGNGQLFLGITIDNFLVTLKIFLEKKFVESEVEQMKLLKKKSVDCCLPFIDYFIIDMENKEKCYVIVMKFFEGYVILSDHLKKCMFPIANVKEQIEKFVTTMHKNQIAHNDIDVGNVLIHCKTGQIKMIDLGFCFYKFDISEDQFKIFVQRDFQLINQL